jgi:putative peptidoglycan lipid II flippase
MSRAPSVAAAALLLAASILASRVLGYLRDVVLAWQFGASAQTDAYHAAFWLPDLLNYFLAGGALSLTFIPLYATLVTQQNADRAWRLFWTLALTTVLLLVPSIAVAWVFAADIVRLMYPGFSAEQTELTVQLTRIILPGPIFFALGGLIGATELANRRFVAAALSPLIYNLCIVLGGTVAAPWLGISGFSVGVMAGAVLGPFLLTAAFAVRHVRWVKPLSLREVEVRRYWFMALPLMLGVSLTTVDEWLGRWAASSLEPGSLTWLNNARRLMLVPVALLGQAAGQAALPFLAKLQAESREPEFQRVLSDSLRLTWSLAMVMGLGLSALAAPAAGAVYGWGAYDEQDVGATAAVLAVLALAVPSWCAQSVLTRAWYARQRMWAPMLLTTLCALVMIPVYRLGAQMAGLSGIAWATVAGLALTYVVLLGAGEYTGVSRATSATWSGLWRGGVAGVAGVVGVRLAQLLLPEAGAVTQLVLNATAYAAFAMFPLWYLDTTTREWIVVRWRRLSGRIFRPVGKA